ncbi:TonB-dependent receptor [Sphingobacterium sp. DN00404]|uniref:TonB-dependent receptor n=1 Tax=Sphingobacterium micropteri TaxID=2763501 RepID=A0ABR7YIX0_9SPHI|nr:TonB-dependent receptor [Sphingobacterium micropteri]MBD1431268.1 TonB-dependent receptor [Sphingobacterium micropteri]
MRIQVIIFLIGLLNSGLFANPALSQTTISLDLKKANLKTLFTAIEGNTEYVILYKDNVPVNTTVSIQVKNEAVGKVLETTLKPLGLKYKIVDNQIIVTANVQALESFPTSNRVVDQSEVAGTVLNNQGEPLQGVSVVVKGTSKGTTTDAGGKFLLSDLNDSDILVFSYQGYAQQEISLNGRNLLHIRMQEQLEELEDVVVVGYGTQRRSDLTGAITSVKSEEVARTSGGNATEALQGKSGVHILSAGSPGTSPVVRIRGVGTNGDPNPLYVVDGMFVDDIQYLNQHDIESMEVLKDASATAIYGSRGANGVILVTTKKGRSGRALINFTGGEGFQFLARKYQMADATEYATLQNIIADGRGVDRNPAYSNPSSFGKGTNWIDATTQNAAMRDYQLSASGGNEDITYHASVGWFDQDGVLRHTDYDRLTARLNNTYKVHDKIRLGHNLTFSNAKNTPYGSMAAMRIMNSIYTISPLIAARNDAGDFNVAQHTEIINPYAALYYSKDAVYNTKRFMGNAYADVDLLPGLTFRSSFGFDYSDVKNKIFEDAYDLGTTHQQHFVNSLQYDFNSLYTWLWENTLTYDKQFGKHHLNLLGGITAQNTDADFMTLTGSGVLSNDPRFLQPQTIPPSSIGVGTELYPYSNSIMSYLFRANYNYEDRYLLTTSFRADGSSKFHRDNRWGYFPSVAVGWRISQEDFMQDVSWVNNLKLRASWGQIGNEKIDNYLYIPVAIQDPVYNGVFNGAPMANFAITNEFNRDIKWEHTEQLDVGLEFSTLANRLSVEFDYFNRDTKNLLFAPAHPGGSTGIAPATRNVGSVRNRGYEFTIGWNDNINDFNYGVRFAGSHFKNTVLNFDNQILTGGEWMSSAVTRGEEGYPLWYFYGYDAIGVYQTSEDLQYWNDYASALGRSQYDPNAKVGDLIFRDVNGDGQVTGDDQTYLGSPYPKFTGSLFLSASYKGFDLAVDVTGVWGASIYNNARNRFVDASFNMHREWLGAWTPTNTDTDMPRLDPSAISFNRSSSFNVQNADYVKFRHIELGYTFGENFLSKWNIQKIRLFANASNPFYITKYQGFSPEVSSGIDFSTYPVAGSFRAGLNLTF